MSVEKGIGAMVFPDLTNEDIDRELSALNFGEKKALKKAIRIASQKDEQWTEQN